MSGEKYILTVKFLNTSKEISRLAGRTDPSDTSDKKIRASLAKDKVFDMNAVHELSKYKNHCRDLVEHVRILTGELEYCSYVIAAFKRGTDKLFSTEIISANEPATEGMAQNLNTHKNLVSVESQPGDKVFFCSKNLNRKISQTQIE